MKITKIEAQVKTKGRYSIYVDDKFAFGISELGLINSGIKSGLEIDNEELERLEETAKSDKIHNLLLSLIARRPRSRWELEDYLKRKKVNQAVSLELIQKLEEKGFVNDMDFAKLWIENRRLLKPISRRKLESELRQKRVADDLIQQALGEDDTTDTEVLGQEIERKRRQTRYQDDTKLMRYLAGQGYRYEDIKSALAD